MLVSEFLFSGFSPPRKGSRRFFKEVSDYGFHLGLTRTRKDDVFQGLILITPGALLEHSKFDEESFCRLNDFLFFKVIDRSGRAMDCKFLGVEGSSRILSIVGISIGETLTLAIPESSLSCGRMMTDVFKGIIGDRAVAALEPSPRLSIPAAY